MAWIKIESKLRPVVQRIQRSLSRINVKGNLRWVYFQCKTNSTFSKDIQNRIESLREQLVSVVNHRLRYWRERVQKMPNARTGKAVDDFDTELLCCSRSCFQLFNRSFVHTFRISISPNVRRQNRFVTRVNDVTNRLTNEMRTNRMTLQP